MDWHLIDSGDLEIRWDYLVTYETLLGVAEKRFKLGTFLITRLRQPLLCADLFLNQSLSYLN